MEKQFSAQQLTRKKNFLVRVHEIQTLYLKKIDGLPDTIFYKTHIYLVFFISIQTFREYLTINVRRDLKAFGFDPDTVLALG